MPASSPDSESECTSGANSDPLIRVALVEDDVLFQHAFQEAIRQAADMQLLSMSSTLALGLQELQSVAPDVLLVDIGLPDGSGVDLIRVAHERHPDCNIMVCTAFGDELHVMQSIEAGASGYLLKDSAPEKIISEIRSLHGGGSPISPLIARQVLMRFRGGSKVSPAAVESAAGASGATPGMVVAGKVAVAVEATVELSAREKEVLEFITRGFTADEIAGLMHISRHTVLTFIRRIYAKLEVHSKTEAIFEARSRGLIGE
jgi:DNA-binding NarL/FixJ family response regulator